MGSNKTLFILIGIALILTIAIFSIKKTPKNIKKAVKPEKGTKEMVKVSSNKEVIELAQQKLKSDPNDKGALLNLLGVSLKEKDMEKAHQYAQKLLKLYPNDSKVLNNVALLKILEGKVDEAENLFEKALNNDSQNTDALYNLAMISQQKGKLEEALDYLDRYLKIKPDDYDVLALKGEVLKALGKFQEAQEVLKRAVEKSPHNVELLFSLADLYFKLNKLDLAEDYIEKALKLEESWKYYRLLGLIYFRKNQLSLSMSTFEKGYEMIPDPLPQEELGELVSFLNDYAYILLQGFSVTKNHKLLERAEWMLKKVLSFAPQYLPAKSNLAIVNEDKGDYQTAVKLYQEVLVKDPKNVVALTNLGLIYMNIKKDYDKAEEMIGRILKMDPSNMAAHFNYALIQYHKGNKSLSIREFQLVIKNAKGTPLAKMAKNLLQKIQNKN